MKENKYTACIMALELENFFLQGENENMKECVQVLEARTIILQDVIQELQEKIDNMSNISMN